MKTDKVGRVRTPRARQEELLDEFERSGVSGPKFAALIGVNYQTFAGWAKRRRKDRAVNPPDCPKSSGSTEWVEAVIERQQTSSADLGLMVHLSGGVRLEVKTPGHAHLAVQLIQLLEQAPAGAC
jgi:hypothetical protein